MSQNKDNQPRRTQRAQRVLVFFSVSSVRSVFLILIFVALIGGGLNYILTYSNNMVKPLNQSNENIQPQAVPMSHEQEKIEAGVIDDDDVRGNQNANLVIVEFCDFQYTACANTYPAIKRVLEAYPGRVKFVYRDFPLSDVHAFAQEAAEAGECAGEQEKYWEYHDKLFESQEWKEKGAPQLKKYAEELNLDIEGFNSCFDNRKYKDEVLKDLNDGKNLGITVVPAFFINSKILIGTQTFEDFQKTIEKELNKVKEKQNHGEIEFYSFEKGMEEAKRYNKTVLIYFRSDSCYWCMKFDEEVLTNKSVVDKINESFIPVAVDIDSEKKLSSKLNVFLTPTIMIMDNSGNELEKLIGFRDAGRFLEELNSAIWTSSE